MKISHDDMKNIATTVRLLAADAVQKANSGHPGLPMGCADIATVLWTKFLTYNPDDPGWINRDRFILSGGHGSMLLYSMLHLAGYNVSMEELKNFRQLGSITPGDPEFHMTPGVETTTGPLGQGIANAVGMAMAGLIMAETFNKYAPLIDHYVYVLATDGDLMEGLSHEAASLAGHWGLGNLIVIYDSNSITIEGTTSLAYSDDVRQRFQANHWHVQEINGHNFDEIEKAVQTAKDERTKPSIIIATTTIAQGSPNKAGSEDSHGAPLGDEELKLTKQNLNRNPEQFFYVPPEVYDLFTKRNKELAASFDQWTAKLKKALDGDFKRVWESYFGPFDADLFREKLPVFKLGEKIATRSAGGKVLESLYKEIPNLLGGSADLAPSNKTFVKGFSESGRNTIGRNFHFGVREHAMGSIQNGIAYYGGLIPFSATFLVFLDYMRPAVRIAALSKLHCIYVFTHDSIFVGEDGPTHQPVEHLASARAIPNLTIIRPADAQETSESWIAALNNTTGPTALILTRQNLPVLDRRHGSAKELQKGAYVIWETGPEPEVIILASGSEVHIAIEAAINISGEGIGIRVISFPSWELFNNQPDEYRSAILPEEIKKRVVVEAALSMGWEKYAGDHACYITMEDFGASAPAEDLAGHFGFTSANIANRVREYLRTTP